MDAKKTKKIAEGNRYDKILKENARKIFAPLLEKFLGVKFKDFNPKPEKMQTTLEREMDFFYEIFTTNNQLFFLHLEFQTEDEKDLVFRIGEYVAMARKRWKKPIKPVVIHLGKKPSTVRTKLTDEEIYSGFDVLNICEMSPFELLASEIPEMVILALYSDYKIKDVDMILTLILRRLKEICGERELNKFLSQLLLLSKLRKLEGITTEKITEMIKYKLEEDDIYLMGVRAEKKRADQAIQFAEEKTAAERKKAEAEKRKAETEKRKADAEKRKVDIAIIKLRYTKKLEIAEIADIFNVTEAYVYALISKE